MAKPKASSKPKAKAKATTPKTRVKSEPKDSTVKWVWILTIAVVAFALIITFLAFWISELYKTLGGDNSELTKSGVRTSYSQVVSWNENGKKALLYEITLANNSDKDVTSWKYEIETNGTAELKEANECQAFISGTVLTVIPKGNSSIAPNSKIKFNVILLDNGEDTISNFLLYVNNEKYSKFSATTNETTMLITTGTKTEEEPAAE